MYTYIDVVKYKRQRSTTTLSIWNWVKAENIARKHLQACREQYKTYIISFQTLTAPYDRVVCITS